MKKQTVSLIELLQRDQLDPVDQEVLESGIAKAFEEMEANRNSINHNKIASKIETKIRLGP